MIFLYSGTPGSGKSYHAVADIAAKLRRREKNGVIANFPLLTDQIKRCKGKFTYLDNSEITVPYLTDYAAANHVQGVEGQTLLVIDEAQCLFNSREWASGVARMDWIRFFSQHRKLGYNVILIAQYDRMLDRQIRCCVEYEYSHLKINNGVRWLPITMFLCVERWYGQKMKLSSTFIRYRRKVARLYDSYAMFAASGSVPAVAAAGGTAKRWGPAAPAAGDDPGRADARTTGETAPSDGGTAAEAAQV